MVKIGNIVFISFAAVVTALIIAKYIVNLSAPVQLAEKSFYCGRNSCEYTFELQNTSAAAHSGTVYIHFRVGGFKTGTILNSVEKPFTLKPNESVVVSDFYKTNRQNINVYYAVTTNES